MREIELVDTAITQLRRMLPASWVLERSHGTPKSEDPEIEPLRLDGTIDLRAANGTSTQIALRAERSFSPRAAEQLLQALAEAPDSFAERPILLICGWLSSRSQELLAGRGVSYFDLTGNALISLEEPALFIKSLGAARDPQPAPRAKVRLNGSKAARVVRLLADVTPPYRVGEIASSTGLTSAYVSGLLDSLDRETLIERSGRGKVSDVDISGLLRRFAESYDIFKTNRTRRFVASGGTLEVLSRLPDLPDSAALTITGSFAAADLAALAVPAILIAYTRDPKAVVARLELTRAQKGVNVILLSPFDEVVWERTSEKEGIRYVSPAQAAVDCLTGSGRMPAEGAALLRWMLENQSSWRAPSLRDSPAVSDPA